LGITLSQAKYKYIYYEEGDSKKPVEEYLKQNCTAGEKAKFFKILRDYVERYDPKQPPPHKIIHAVEEFSQITFGPHRCLIMVEGREFLLLHAFRKKTNKTPESEKSKARNYWQKHCERRKKEN